MQQINIVNFDGVNNIVSPYKLGENLSSEFRNINTHNKTLKSVKENLVTALPTVEAWYYKTETWEKWSAEPISHVYLNRYIYYTKMGRYGSDTDVLMRENPDSSEHVVGIITPPNAPTLAESGDFYRAADFYYAYYFYAVTFYDSATGEESGPALSLVLGATKKIIDLTIDLGPLPTNADKVRIYRVGGFTTRFSLVDEVDFPGTGTILTYADIAPDTALTRLMVAKVSELPPVGIRNLVFHNGKFYASVRSRLHFSHFGNASSWDALAYMDFQSEITALASINGLLLVFLDNQVYTFSGSDVNDYRLTILSGNVGCEFPESVQHIQDMVVWFTDDGIAITDGNNINFVTRQVFDFDPTLIVKDSTVFKGSYYMLAAGRGVLCDEVLDCEDVIPCGEPTIYELDFTENMALRLYDIPSTTESLTTYRDKFWAVDTTIGFLSEVFKGYNYASMTYVSRKITAPAYVFTIEAKKFVIRYRGDFDILFYAESKEILGQFSVSSETVTLEEYSFKFESNEVQALEVRVIGTGVIYAMAVDVDYPETYAMLEDN